MLDITESHTISIHVQDLKGSFGTVDLGSIIAIIVYLIYIIKGVAAGAVKG